MMRKIIIGVLWFVIILVIILSCGLGYVIYESTVIEWWIAIAVAMAAALITTPFYRKWRLLTSLDSRVVNLLFHWVCVGTLSYLAFLGGNDWLSRSAVEYQAQVLIEGKYQKRTEKVRQVRKYRYVSDGFRTEYYLLITFDNGETKMLHVSPAIFKKTRKGKTRIIDLREGFFGFPVIVNK